jgi:UTP--glucose-1-phosphate uridylyltransferase
VGETDFLNELSDEQRDHLKRYHFEEAAFRRLREQYLADELTEDSNRIRGEVTPPTGDDIVELPEPGTDRFHFLAETGKAAIEAGEVGHVVLNGGMATRFGGVVKGSVEVTDGISFLGLKLMDAARWGGRVPVMLMNSFATEEKTAEHLQNHDHFGFPSDRVWSIDQNISVQIAPDGHIFRDEDGNPSFYGPGHGDLPSAIRRGTLQKFREQGGKYLMMSNVDNVLATVDPVVVGAHVEASKQREVEMTVEAAPRYEGDRGGMPARVDGELQVVEAFRFPEGFDDSSIPVFNTNTFFFDARALDQDFDLTWFVVQKMVDGQPAIQFERLAGELSAFLKSQFIAIPREGTASRFLPVKRPEDLENHRDYLARVMRKRRILE